MKQNISNLLNELNKLNKEDKLQLLESLIPERYKPCEINNPDNTVTQGIVKSIKKGINFSGFKATVLIQKNKKVFEEEVPLKNINRISWDDYVFPEGDRLTKQLKIYIKDGMYYLLLDSGSKVFESYKESQKYYLLFSLATSRESDDKQELLQIPVKEFDQEYSEMSKMDDPNAPEIKEFMFSEERGMLDISVFL